MTTDGTGRSGAPSSGRAAALLGVLLIAVNLRPVVTSLSPIAGLLPRGIASPTALAVLAAAPPLAFVAGGLAVPRLVARVAPARVLLVTAVLMTVGQAVRFTAPDSAALVAGSVVAFLGIGVVNVLLPAAVKGFFPERSRSVITAYSALLAVGTVLPALVSVPVAESAGWRTSLALWCALAVVAVPVWAVLARRSVPARRTVRSGLGRGVARSRPAWGVLVVFAVTSVNVYSCFAWLPDILVASAHVSAAGAGALLGLYAAVGVPSAFVVPAICARLRRPHLLIPVFAAFLVLGYAGLAFVPERATAVWVVLIGLGPMLPLSFVLIDRRSATAAGATALSAFTQNTGYLLAAIGPVAAAVLHAATGGWTAPVLMLLATGLLAILGAVLLSDPAQVDADAAGLGPDAAAAT